MKWKMIVQDYVKAKLTTWPLMESPAPLVLILSVYLCIVMKLGPEFMTNRKPMKLTNFTRVYNVFQVITCSAFIYYGYKDGFSFKTMWKCVETRPSYDAWLRYKTTQWLFLFLRLAELSETVVFVLRKKQNQVSILHVYHHISTAVIVWIYTKYNNCEFCH